MLYIGRRKISTAEVLELRSSAPWGDSRLWAGGSRGFLYLQGESVQKGIA